MGAICSKPEDILILNQRINSNSSLLDGQTSGQVAGDSSGMMSGGPQDRSVSQNYNEGSNQHQNKQDRANDQETVDGGVLHPPEIESHDAGNPRISLNNNISSQSQILVQKASTSGAEGLKQADIQDTSDNHKHQAAEAAHNTTLHRHSISGTSSSTSSNKSGRFAKLPVPSSAPTTPANTVPKLLMKTSSGQLRPSLTGRPSDFECRNRTTSANGAFPQAIHITDSRRESSSSVHVTRTLTFGLSSASQIPADTIFIAGGADREEDTHEDRDSAASVRFSTQSCSSRDVHEPDIAWPSSLHEALKTPLVLSKHKAVHPDLPPPESVRQSTEHDVLSGQSTASTRSSSGSSHKHLYTRTRVVGGAHELEMINEVPSVQAEVQVQSYAHAHSSQLPPLASKPSQSRSTLRSAAGSLSGRPGDTTSQPGAQAADHADLSVKAAAAALVTPEKADVSSQIKAVHRSSRTSSRSYGGGVPLPPSHAGSDPSNSFTSVTSYPIMVADSSVAGLQGQVTAAPKPPARHSASGIKPSSQGNAATSATVRGARPSACPSAPSSGASSQAQTGKHRASRARPPSNGGKAPSNANQAQQQQQFHVDPGALSRLSQTSSMSGDVLGLPTSRYPAPKPGKQVDLACLAAEDSLARAVPGAENSYHSSRASELGDSMAASELSASLPPSNFGTQRHTRNPSRVMDSKDGGVKGIHGMSQAVDAQVAAEALQHLLQGETSHMSVASETSSCFTPAAHNTHQLHPPAGNSTEGSRGNSQGGVVRSTNNSAGDIAHNISQSSLHGHGHSRAPQGALPWSQFPGLAGLPAAPLPSYIEADEECDDDDGEEDEPPSSKAASRPGSRHDPPGDTVAANKISDGPNGHLVMNGRTCAENAPGDSATQCSPEAKETNADSNTSCNSATAVYAPDGIVGARDFQGESVPMMMVTVSQDAKPGSRDAARPTAQDPTSSAVVSLTVDKDDGRHVIQLYEHGSRVKDVLQQAVQVLHQKQCAPSTSTAGNATGPADRATGTGEPHSNSYAAQDVEEAASSSKAPDAESENDSPFATLSAAVIASLAAGIRGIKATSRTNSCDTISNEHETVADASHAQQLPAQQPGQDFLVPGTTSSSSSHTKSDKGSDSFPLALMGSAPTSSWHPSELCIPEEPSNAVLGEDTMDIAAAAAARTSKHRVSSSKIPELVACGLKEKTSSQKHAPTLAHTTSHPVSMVPGSRGGFPGFPSSGPLSSIKLPPQMHSSMTLTGKAGAPIRRRLSMSIVDTVGRYSGQRGPVMSTLLTGSRLRMPMPGHDALQTRDSNVSSWTQGTGTASNADFLHTATSGATDDTDARFMSVLSRLARTQSDSGGCRAKNRCYDPYATCNSSSSDDHGMASHDVLERFSMLLPPSRLTRDSANGAATSPQHGNTPASPACTPEHDNNSSHAAMYADLFSSSRRAASHSTVTTEVLEGGDDDGDGLQARIGLAGHVDSVGLSLAHGAGGQTTNSGALPKLPVKAAPLQGSVSAPGMITPTPSPASGLPMIAAAHHHLDSHVSHEQAGAEEGEASNNCTLITATLPMDLSQELPVIVSPAGGPSVPVKPPSSLQLTGVGTQDRPSPRAAAHARVSTGNSGELLSSRLSKEHCRSQSPMQSPCTGQVGEEQNGHRVSSKEYEACSVQGTGKGVSVIDASQSVENSQQQGLAGSRASASLSSVTKDDLCMLQAAAGATASPRASAGTSAVASADHSCVLLPGDTVDVHKVHDQELVMAC